MKTLRIPYCFDAECEAYLDGVKTRIKITHNNQQLVIKDLDNNASYVATAIKTTVPNEIQFDIQ